jgi:hypothetical protein
MEFGLVIGFIEHLLILTTSNYSTITNSYTLQFTAACTKLFSLLCLHQSLPGNSSQWQTFPLLWVSWTIPVPQLPASNSSSSQQLNCIIHLTAYSPTNSLHSTVLNWTELNSTQLDWSSHIVLEQTHKEHCLQHLFYCCVTSPQMWRVPQLRVYGPLPSNRSVSAAP